MPEEISPRTGKPKRKPRGRPFFRGTDPRRPGETSGASHTGATVTPAAAKPSLTAPKPLADFMADALNKSGNSVAEALKAGDMAKLASIHAEAKKEAEAAYGEAMRSFEAEKVRLAEIEAALQAKLAADVAAKLSHTGAIDLSGINPKEFPVDELLKLADGIESARKTGKIGVGFSARRQTMASRLWVVFRGFGLSSADAFRLTFALLASERATDDERPFYEELWLSKMGTKLYPLPELPTPPSKKGEIWHPQAGTVVALIRAGIPIWLAGDPGAGKTFLTEQVATLLGRPYHRLQGSRDRTLEEVVGAWGFSPEKGTVFRYGAVPVAMQEGAVLHIDEISALPSEVTFEMHAVLEGKPLTLLRKDSEVIPATKGFALVANDNTIGEGERSDMIGTQPVNAAFRDRWTFLRIDGMSKTLRKNMMFSAVETQLKAGI